MRRSLTTLTVLLLLAACGGKEPVSVHTTPAIKAEPADVAAYRTSFTVSTIHTETLLYGYSSTGTPALDRQMPTGNAVTATLTLVLDDLEPDTNYRLSLQGIGPSGETGNTVTLSFRTLPGASSLYSWERERTGLPIPADMTLIPGPSSHRSPLGWSKERWLSHVAYTDEEGTEHWLFDSFLLIEGQQNGAYGSPIITYSVTDEDRPSATKADWQHLLDFWFSGGTFLWQESYWGNGKDSFGRWYTGKTETVTFPEGQLDALEACIEEVSARIGEPAHKRYVVMALPEPIYYDNYILGVSNPASARTTYWGSLDGKALDFARVADRIAACRWYMDETRKAFGLKNYRHIELLGFYILPEVLSTTWRAQYKNYDIVIPALAEYAHSCNEALYWIPYNMAEGYKSWKQFGMDIAYMQPNYYWEPDKKPLAATFREINRYDMGLELEFEYSMVENVHGEASASLYRSRFREYLQWAVSSGVYGNRSIALYSGTDAMHQLAESPLTEDRKMYHELGHFIIESPLKK